MNDALHAAICKAVSILNVYPTRDAEPREVRNILRQALLDYADAAPVPAEDSGAGVTDEQIDVLHRSARIESAGTGQPPHRMFARAVLAAAATAQSADAKDGGKHV